MREDIKERIAMIQKGEVPEGYKRIKNEIYADDFRNACFREMGCFKNGINFNKEEGKVQLKFIGVGDFKDNETFSVTRETSTVLCVSECEEYYLKEKDILFVRSNGTKELVGRSMLIHIGEEKAVYSGFCIRYRMFEEETRLLPEYLNLWLQNGVLKRLLKKESRGTNINNLNQEILNKLKVYFPKREEQEKIIRLVKNYTRKIYLQKKLIKEKEEEKRYWRKVLLKGEKRLKGFSKDWKKVKLGEILIERNEYAQKNQGYEHASLTKDGIYKKTERYNRDFLVKDDEKKYKVTHLNDICYNPANLKFGVICKNNLGDAIFSPIYITYEVKDSADIEFITQYLCRWDFINAVRKYEEGTVYERMAVSSEDFLKFEITIPDIEEQKTIAKILTTEDKEIELLKRQLELFKQEKKAMMQLLLTGIVRVNELKEV